jgi:hypothetical protein
MMALGAVLQHGGAARSGYSRAWRQQLAASAQRCSTATGRADSSRLGVRAGDGAGQACSRCAVLQGDAGALPTDSSRAQCCSMCVGHPVSALAAGSRARQTAAAGIRAASKVCRARHSSWQHIGQGTQTSGSICRQGRNWQSCSPQA